MIRPYKADDLDTIIDIGNGAYQYIYANFRQIYGDELFEFLYPDEKTKTMKGLQIKDFCEKYPDSVYICEEEGRIVGFIQFIAEKDTKIGVVWDNAVDPDWRHKGIGQQMYKAMFDYFKQQGMLYARVRTDMDNIPARRAYERAGFSIKREDVTYYKRL